MTPMNKGFEVILASSSQYSELVAEIYFDGAFVALLNKEKGADNIELELADASVDQSMVCRNLDLKSLLAAVEVARQRLIGKV